MYMYIYENHMGGLYATDEVLSYEETYCETCGDSDTLIGSADSADEAWALLKDECDIDGSGGYEVDYVKACINGWFVDAD